jgi:para-nitrobenzyl esterase
MVPSLSLSQLNKKGGGRAMRKAKGAGVRLTLVFISIAVFMLLVSGGYLDTSAALAQGQVQAVDSMRPDRETTEGVVIGVIHKATNTLSWKGIPYAKPPVGDLRWKAPQAPEKRSTPFKAVNFCEVCPQYVDHDNNPSTPNVIQGTEDCLYLNIWRPRTKAADLPVYFWIHGGAHSAQLPLLSDTDASILANRSNMIVVTMNYRLGPMGFFSHPALRSGKAGDEKSDSGNFALLDLLQALSWVKDNIKAFGGDPANVTIAGESAGGQDVISLMASPLAKGLFHRAISESGIIRPTTPEEGMAHANMVIGKLLVKDGRAPDETAAADRLKGMSRQAIEKYVRSKSAQEFLECYPLGKFMGIFFFPTSFSDGTVLPADVYGALKAGSYNKVPTILGTNKEEVKFFFLFSPRFIPWRNDGSLFKDPAKAELYDLAAKYQSDGWKVMAVDQLARIMRSNADQPPVYAYQFLWGAGGLKKSVLPFPYNQLLGACHAMELDFVFGTEAVGLGLLAFDEKNRPGRVALSQAMMDYWAQFARTGDPNRKESGLPQWKLWSNDKGSPKTILLDADYDNLKIKMSKQELTEADIEKALKAEPRQKEIQPFWDTSLARSRMK